LAPLNAVRGAAVLGRWQTLIAEGETIALTRALMQDHYDPAYARSRTGIGVPPMAQVHSDALEDAGLETLSDQIESIMDQMITD
ncbi:MAG: tRNA 2-selenouridine(34) synthase MnmH, partial [Paracoccaceae bacterium]